MARANKKDISIKDIISFIPNYLNDREIIKTNIFALDLLLNGGIELGNSIQLLAESGIGKSTIALQIAKSFCKQDKKVIYLDTESSVSNEIINSIGLSEYVNNSFFYIQESTFENVEKYLDTLISTGEIKLVIIDSLAGLVNSGFTNLKNGISISTNSSVYTSRPLSLFMNKYKSLSSSRRFGLLFINQFRNRVDTMKGTILKEYGGKNVKYNSDIILRINAINSTSSNKRFKELTNNLSIGNALEFEIIKSNKNKPNVTMPFYLNYGMGISNLVNYIYALILNEEIIKDGSYYKITYDNKTIKENGFKNLYNKLIEIEFNIEGFNLQEIENAYKNENAGSETNEVD